MQQPFFVSDIAFEGPGSKFTLKLRQGDKLYEFSTNYIEVYPIKITKDVHDESNPRSKLEEMIKERTDAEFSVDIVDYKLLELTIDKDKFKELNEKLPNWLKGRFQQKYKPKARWEIGVHRKVELTPNLETILKSNHTVNQDINDLRWALRDYYSLEIKRESQWWYEQISKQVDNNDFEGIRNDLNELIPERKISKDVRTYLFDQLKDIINGSKLIEKTPRNIKNLKHIIANTFAKTIHFTYEKEILSESKFLLKNKEKEAYNENILSLRDNILNGIFELNKQIKEIDEENNYFLDIDHLKAQLYLNIMSRDKNKRIDIEGLTFKEDEYKKQTLTLDELNALPSGCLDIEKFQFGSIFEQISHAGLKLLYDKPARDDVVSKLFDSVLKLANYIGIKTKNKDNKKILRVVDTIRHNKKPYVDNYLIRTENWEHETIINTARSINEKNPFLMHFFNANYDLKNYKESMDFLLGIDEKPPRKEATIDKQEDGSDFMGRYGMINQQIIDWYKFINVYAPHMLARRLGTFLNKVLLKDGKNVTWKKTITYEEGRENDILSTDFDSEDEEKKEQAYEHSRKNLFYTKEDVELLEEIVRQPVGQAMLQDMLDIRDTFNITLTQLTSLGTTVRNYLEQKFYEKNKHFLNTDFFRKEKRKAVANFKSNYTNLKLKTFKKHKLNIYPEKKVYDEVYQYYFSLEMNVALFMNNHFKEIKNFIDDTKKISDPERQVGRLQYVRNFFIPMLSDYTTLRKKKEKIIEELNENKYIKTNHPFNNLLDKLKMNVGKNKEIQMSNFNEKIKDFFNEFRTKKTDTTNSKTQRVFNMLKSYDKSSWFFSEVWGTQPSNIETYIDKTFSQAVKTLNQNNAKPVQLTGKFVFTKNKIPDEEAVQAGLFELRKIPIYKYGNDKLVYFSEGKYSNCPNRPIATANYSLFEIELMNNVLDLIFHKDYRSAFDIIGSAARRINNLSDNSKDDENNELIQSLLYHVRSRNIYKAFELSDDGINIVEFGEDEKHEFKPDLNYYKEVFFGNVFGGYNIDKLPNELAKKKNYKALSLNGRISELITGIYPLEPTNKIIKTDSQLSFFKTSKDPTQLYLELIKSDSKIKQENIIDQMMEYIKP